MKKIAITLLVTFSVCALFAQTPVKKTWNDGTNTFVPLGTKLRLQAENLQQEAGSIYYTFNFGEPVEYTEPVALSQEGQVWISYATRDVFNTVSNHKTWNGIVDGTAPVPKYFMDGPTYFDEGVFYFTSQTGFLLYGEDEHSGTEHIYVKL
ncbi:MAG TPA: hypothetical protein VJ861_08065, partial [Treponemataceae bacterium]|nr:hypothetical protein [Treponemataceae bacterium]